MIKLLQRTGEGLAFKFVADAVTIKVSARDTNGQYSLMTWVAAPKTGSPPHVHARYEETFYVVEGPLAFVLGDESITLETGDFVRVRPPELVTPGVFSRVGRHARWWPSLVCRSHSANAAAADHSELAVVAAKLSVGRSPRRVERLMFRETTAAA